MVNGRLEMSLSAERCLRAAVPELTRSAGIQLNELVSLRHHLDALSLLHRISPRSGPTVAKPSGDHAPPGGFVFQRACEMPRSTSSHQRWQFRLLIILFVIVVIIATSGWVYLLTKMALWLIAE